MSKEIFKTRLAQVKADVCVHQGERASTAVVPEDVPEQHRRPQCPDLVPAEKTNTPKVKMW